MMLKNKLLGCKLYDEEDFNEIFKWNNSQTEQVAELIENHLINTIDFGEPLTDAKLCPQCQYYISCNACHYGRRHGICDSHKSNTYDDILSSNKASSFIEIMHSKNNDFIFALLNAVEPEYSNQQVRYNNFLYNNLEIN